jgi:hypothetical protein
MRYAAMLVLLAVLGTAGAEEADDTIPGESEQVPASTEAAAAPEKPRTDDPDKPPRRFVPSERISADNAVPFPVDI